MGREAVADRKVTQWLLRADHVGRVAITSTQLLAMETIARDVNVDHDVRQLRPNKRRSIRATRPICITNGR